MELTENIKRAAAVARGGHNDQAWAPRTAQQRTARYAERLAAEHEPRWREIESLQNAFWDATYAKQHLGPAMAVHMAVPQSHVTALEAADPSLAGKVQGHAI